MAERRGGGMGRSRKRRRRGGLRSFLLGSAAVSDAVCWIAFLVYVSRLQPGMGAADTALPTALFLLAAGIVVLWICIVVLWLGIFPQLDDLKDMMRHWDAVRPEERNLFFSTLSGPVGQTGSAVYRQICRLESAVNTIRQETQAETERTVKLQIARDICRTALPGPLPNYPSRENFAVAGIVRDGWRNACVFYDFFYVDRGLLCVSAGQVPDGEVPEALYMTVAQTTIRSRLHLGRSLAETMADVNTQLYGLGSGRSAAVLVGTLDTYTGKFSYVCAGGCVPLLMRNNQDYEWMDTTQFSSLGKTQNVTFRTLELRLRQGDRLFLYTAGLGAVKDADGTAFRDQALRAALIQTQGQEAAPLEALNAVAEKAEQYASPENRLGYAALLLEFRKGDRELSHCRVPASPDSAAEVLAFLKTRFEENGIQRRHYARVAVLAEELFTLCCRAAESGAVLTVECGVAPDGESVNLRVTGPFQGRTPLRANREDTPEGQSAQFIENHAEYTRFKVGETEERDTVTVVCFLT